MPVPRVDARTLIRALVVLAVLTTVIIAFQQRYRVANSLQDPAGGACFYKLAWRLQVEGDVEAARERFIEAIQAEGVAVDAGFRGFTRRSDRRCRKAHPLGASARAARATLLLHHPVLLEDGSTVHRVATALAKVARAHYGV